MRPNTIVLLLLAGRTVALDGFSMVPPSCTTRCMIDSMFITACEDMDCLCHEENYQKVSLTARLEL